MKKSNKITLEEFWNSDERMYIHCKTEEQAKKLCNEFDKLGKKWAVGGDPYISDNCWHYHKANTAYGNDGGIEDVNYAPNFSKYIYKFRDIIF